LFVLLRFSSRSCCGTPATSTWLNLLRGQGYPVRDEDAARLSPLGYAHINMLGRYSFPKPGTGPQLRPLRDPDNPEN
jgi:hypothetical protein